MNLGIFTAARRLSVALIDALAGDRLEAWILQLVRRRVKKLTPENSLKLLFRLDAELYPLQGECSVAYGGGVHSKHRHMKYHDFFVNRIGKGERVLDIGCGIGKLAYEVASRADAQVLGVDHNEDRIAIAQTRFAHPNVSFKSADATKELDEEPFDVAIMSNVLEHLHERPQFLKRVMETSDPKRFLIRVPLFERDWRVPLKKELGLEWRLAEDHKTEYTLESFAEEMAEAGLVVIYQEVRWGEIWAEAAPVKTISGS